MATHVGTYEALFLLNAPYATGSWDAARGEVEHILHRANAEILHLRKWDERKLAYELKGNKRGVYVLVYFKAEGPKVAGIERDVQLSENILRVLVLKADHLALKDVEAMIPQQPVAEEHDTKTFRRGPGFRDGGDRGGDRGDRGGFRGEPRGDRAPAGGEAPAAPGGEPR